MDVHDLFVFHLLLIQQIFDSVLLPYVLSIYWSVLAAYIVHKEDVGQAPATYGMRARCGTQSDFQWHAEWIEVQ
jgi:hypothetical protein